MKAKHQLLCLLTVATPGTAQAYGASGGAILEFFSLCILIPLGIILFFSTNYLKHRAPLVLNIAFTLVGLFMLFGVLGMALSFTTEVGYRPLVIGMHVLLIVFVYLATRHIYRVMNGS